MRKTRAHFFSKSMWLCGFNSALLLVCAGLLIWLIWFLGAKKTEFQCAQEQWYMDHLDPVVRANLEAQMGKKLRACK